MTLYDDESDEKRHDPYAVQMRDTLDDMVDVLLDAEIDLDDRSVCMTTLIQSGFAASAINVFLDDAIEEAKEQEYAVA